MYDTICAISTALGTGGISIIRVSGDNSINVVNKIFDRNLLKFKSHTINYGHIVDGNEIIDEVLVSIMKSPKTFTCEDIVEINCHGGIAVTNKILELVIKNGARLALPGEFTKRAFLNGRIDLIEAEAVMDIINSKTETSRKMAMESLTGRVSNMIHKLRNMMLDIIANIEVNIDYPEYEDILVVTNDMLKENIEILKRELSNILEEAKNGRIIKEGIKTVIIGRPNVGKSSLLNLLLDEDKAIVTDIEGTTRDIVEGTITMDGILLNIIDTAGIRETDDIIEKKGVDKSLSLISDADLVILVLNYNQELTEEDIELIESTKDKNRIVFVNKNDLDRKIDLKTRAIYGNTVSIDGIKELKLEIKKKFGFDQIEKKDLTYLSSANDIAIIKECLDIVDEICLDIDKSVSIDIIEIDIKRIWELLGNLIGENYDSELLDGLFSKFCLGK